MAEEERGIVGRFVDRITGNYRRKTTPEPIMPLWKAGIQEPVLVQGVSIPALYATVQESIILRTTINTLCQEIFRRGHYWKKKFHKQCDKCEEEYQHDTVSECITCGGSEFTSPDADQILYPRWFTKQRNGMDQSFTDIMREFEWDLNIVDDGFIVLIKEYFLEPQGGKIEFYRIKEMMRGDPTFMRIVADKRGVRGGRYLVCPVHRDKTYPFSDSEQRCDTCNMDLQDVHFINTAGSGKTQYYIDGEIVHISKFNPSKLYGRSPVATMWRQAMTLTAMDNFMYLSYQKRRMPRGVLAITTDNIQSTASFWKGAEEKMERDPHYIPKVGIESATGRGRVEFVRFMDTLDEMQYGAVRDELRMRIAAFYGVSNIFMMDAGKGGGLNNEGLQILVTNRAVEFGQKLYSRDVFPRLFGEMGVTDWEMTLYPNEEEDEVTRLRRDEQEVNIAQRMAQLGFQPELTEDAGRDIRFVYKQPDPQQGAQMAQQGGMGGGGGPPPEGGGMPPPGMGGMPMGMGGMPMGMGGMPMGGPMAHPGSMGGAHISPSAGNAMPTPHTQATMGDAARRGAGTAMGQTGTRHGALEEMAMQNLRHRRGAGGGEKPAPIMMMEKGINAGSDSEGTGRRTSISGVTRVKAPDGTTTGATKTGQRGSDKSHIEEALDAVQDAKESAASPLGDKKKKGGLPR